MIQTRNQLKNILNIEFTNYFPNKSKYLQALLKANNNVLIWRYQKKLRYLEYYKNTLDKVNSLQENKISVYFRLKNLLQKYLCSVNFILCCRRVNKLGLKLGIDTWHNVFEEGLLIYHTSGGIVVNSNARIGKNCHLHGNNCIGNNGSSPEAPQLGDNCSLGVGAKIIGNIKLGNNIKIAAGAVVIRDCLQDGVILAGIPAEIKNKKGQVLQ